MVVFVFDDVFILCNMFSFNTFFAPDLAEFI